MANLRRPRRSPSGLEQADGPPRIAGRTWLPAAAFVIGGLLALAWLDGGEQALRPIAEDVTLPGQGR
jgi:hypothetical protein